MIEDIGDDHPKGLSPTNDKARAEAAQQQPEPTEDSEAVLPGLLQWLDERRKADALPDRQFVDLARLLAERAAVGVEEYGQLLYTEDGRDTRRDAVEEAVDLLQYVWSGYLQGFYREEVVRSVVDVITKLRLSEEGE